MSGNTLRPMRSIMDSLHQIAHAPTMAERDAALGLRRNIPAEDHEALAFAEAEARSILIDHNIRRGHVRPAPTKRGRIRGYLTAFAVGFVVATLAHVALAAPAKVRATLALHEDIAR